MSSVTIILDEQILERLERLANKESKSVSSKIADLITAAVRDPFIESLNESVSYAKSMSFKSDGPYLSRDDANGIDFR